MIARRLLHKDTVFFIYSSHLIQRILISTWFTQTFKYDCYFIYREMNVQQQDEIALLTSIFNVLHLMVWVRIQYWRQVIATMKFIQMLRGCVIFLGCDKLHVLIVLWFVTLWKRSNLFPRLLKTKSCNLWLSFVCYFQTTPWVLLPHLNCPPFSRI